MNLERQNIVIIGASGAIGNAFTRLVSKKNPNASLFAFSRNGELQIDYNSEFSIAEAAELAAKERPLDLVIVANGILYDDEIMPEKSLRDLSAKKFHRIFDVNICAELMDYIEALEESLGKTAVKELLPLQPGDVEDTYADVDDLVEQFDYKPNMSVRQGVMNFSKWYKEYNGL